MNFSQALEYMKAGAGVRRQAWPAGCAIRVEGHEIATFDPRTSVRGNVFGFHDYKVNVSDDLLAEDWEIVAPA